MLAGWMWGLLVAATPLVGDEPQEDDPVPPGHRAYVAMHEFAREGYIRRYPAFYFRGGRTFTRRELAELTADLLRTFQADEAALTPARRQRLDMLVEEFNRELRGMGTATDLPPPTIEPPPSDDVPSDAEEPLPIRFFGSDITTWSLTEGKGNDALSSLVDFNVEMDYFHIEAVGTLDDRGADGRAKHTGDVAFSDRYHFDLSERYIELFPPGIVDELYVDAKVGDLRNTTYAQGLLLGAADPDGYQVRTRIIDRVHTHAVWGKTDDGTAIFGARVEGAVLQGEHDLRIGVAAVDVDASDPARRGLGYGADLVLVSNYLDVEAEVVDVEESGYGGYVNATFWYFPNLRFLTEVRRYRELLLRVNNAPIYSGISGADDEDDEGVRVGTIYSPIDVLTFTARVERSENEDGSARLQDGFLEARTNAWEGGELAVSFELEEDRDGRAVNRLGIVDISQRLMEVMTVRTNYTRDDRDGDVIHTFRPTVRLDLIERELAFEYNHTLRMEGGSEEHTFQPRLLWTIAEELFFAVRYTHVDGGESDDMIDFTLVIRW